MLRKIGPEDRAHFDYLIAIAPEPDFAQTAAWADLKSVTWRPVHYLYQQVQGQPLIAITVWLRRPPLSPYCLAYAPRGPILLTNDARHALNQFWQELKQELAKLKAFALKIDPAWTDPQLGEQMQAVGFLPLRSDNAFGGTQPKKTVRQDISADPDELLASIPKKIRYNIRYPEKQGVEYRQGNISDIPDLISVLRDTSRRKNFLGREADYYRRLLKCMGDNASLILGYQDGQVVAAGVTVVCGKNAWAVYGGMMREHSQLRPYYGLNWQRMLWAKSKGASVFDFFGIPVDLSPESPLYGLYSFKKSFGGDVVEFIGEYELPIRALPYWFWRTLSPTVLSLLKWMTKLLRRGRQPSQGEGQTEISGG
ncbi:MAG: lipid II:glycine glycyltransferase FemX [Bacillota bacterium]|jgi:peptidoglycan pentaglycine glycine transferase (the first glycine)